MKLYEVVMVSYSGRSNAPNQSGQARGVTAPLSGLLIEALSSKKTVRKRLFRSPTG